MKIAGQSGTEFRTRYRRSETSAQVRGCESRSLAEEIYHPSIDPTKGSAVKSLLDKITRVKIADLHQYPGNAKRGDVKAIGESLEENDQFQPVIVQKSTMYILSGNHTVQAAEKAGWTEIDACVIDVDDKRALKINLAANRTADRGSYDVDARNALLEALEGDYTGTGYTEKEVEQWMAVVEEALPEPGDAETEEQERAWGVIVTCADEKEQTALLKRFAGEGLIVRALML